MDEKQGAYPPAYDQAAGYPQGYPPAQPGYPVGYPPAAQLGYPAQPGYPGYPPTQPAGYPAPQAYPPQGVQQQQSSNVVVVQQQPTAAVYTSYVQRTSGDHYLTLSIVLTAICLFCGSWWSLLCTIPAILFALNAKSAEERGDLASARSNTNLALGLDIAAVVFYVVIVVVIIASVTGSIASGGYYYNYYSSYNYNSYYNYYYK